MRHPARAGIAGVNVSNGRDVVLSGAAAVGVVATGAPHAVQDHERVWRVHGRIPAP